MLCFEVALNRKRLCVAGVRGYGVLTTLLAWAHRDPRKRQEFVPPEEWARDLLNLDVGGLSNRSHLKWVDRDVKVGDVISVRIVERAAADRPRRRESAGAPGRKAPRRKRAAARRRS